MWLTRGNSDQTFGTHFCRLAEKQRFLGFASLFSLVLRELGRWVWMMNSEGQQELVVGYFTAPVQHIPVGSDKNHEYLPGYSASVLRAIATESVSYRERYPLHSHVQYKILKPCFWLYGRENHCSSKNKVKLSLCLFKHHAVTTYGGMERYRSTYSYLGTSWMWVVSFTTRPL
jgi:hypothetical protein